MPSADTPKIRSNAGLAVVDGHLKSTFALSANIETNATCEYKMTNAKMAAPPATSGDVCVRGDQQTADFKVAFLSRAMQRSFVTDERSKKLTCAE